MKYIKQFENILYEPEIGDYILIRLTGERLGFAGEEVVKMLHNSIGRIVRTIDSHKDFIWVYYEEANHDYPIKKSEIIYHSKNKEDIQTILDSQKYNL